jgi:protease PrsW
LRSTGCRRGAIPRHLWLWVFIVGAFLWAACAAAIALTDDTILVPNLILLGTFLVPVCTVLFILGRPRDAHLTVETLVLGFLAGGTLGVVLTGTTGSTCCPTPSGPTR